MSNDNPQAVLRRIRLAWSTRRSCGLLAVAAGLRVERVVALAAAGRLSAEDALRMSLEVEAVALCLPPLPAAPC
ncbi:hypothetical protein SAMN02799622_01833 [Methylobacterium sp. UNC378MF]|uniref:DUF1127 domain-containing protein n=1 Tax=Methylobacterium oryzae TaxID=334852 RepID=A0ABU7TN21_9HYPH|nr:hypothetical protein [Methylobacterium sp. UNC378MF]SDA17531.1 hypothetical protein SAMN02799622_01833 [Methylobacterium sp. UNC378MF]